MFSEYSNIDILSDLSMDYINEIYTKITSKYSKNINCSDILCELRQYDSIHEIFLKYTGINYTKIQEQFKTVFKTTDEILNRFNEETHHETIGNAVENTNFIRTSLSNWMLQMLINVLKLILNNLVKIEKKYIQYNKDQFRKQTKTVKYNLERKETNNSKRKSKSKSKENCLSKKLTSTSWHDLSILSWAPDDTKKDKNKDLTYFDFSSIVALDTSKPWTPPVFLNEINEMPTPTFHYAESSLNNDKRNKLEISFTSFVQSQTPQFPIKSHKKMNNYHLNDTSALLDQCYKMFKLNLINTEERNKWKEWIYSKNQLLSHLIAGTNTDENEMFIKWKDVINSIQFTTI